VGISIVNALLTANTQVNHETIAKNVTAVNPALQDPAIAQYWNPFTAAGRAALDAVINQQAMLIAYLNNYKLLMIATLAVLPLLIVFRRPSAGEGRGGTVVVD
jgi:DHA2 family multidrug resistance protein